MTTSDSDDRERAREAARLVERGDFSGALELLRDLVSTDLPDFDKAMMYLNLAVVYEKMDRFDDALTSLATGVDYERRHGGFFVAEQRAVFLSRHGRYRESLTAYQELAGRPDVTEADEERIRHNIALLRGRVP